MWLRALFVVMLAGAAGPSSIGHFLWEPLYLLAGTPIITPLAGSAANIARLTQKTVVSARADFIAESSIGSRRKSH